MRTTLVLKGRAGELRVPVTFDEREHVEEFFRRMADAARMERLMKDKQTSASAQLYGQAVMALYALVFGEEGARTIEAFHGEDMLSMVSVVNPFIVRRVVPAVQRASQKNREREKKAFLRARKEALRHGV